MKEPQHWATAGCRHGSCRKTSANAFSEVESNRPKDYGRDPEKIHLGIEVYGCIDEDGAKARQDGYGTLAIGQSTFERMMSVEQLAAVSLIGSPEEIRKQVKAYSDAACRTSRSSLFIRVSNGTRKCCNFSRGKFCLRFVKPTTKSSTE